MDVLTAMASRKSTRAFTEKEVSKQVLLEILGHACRAPSGVNCQPWEFFIFRGAALDKLKAGCLAAHRAGEPKTPDVAVAGMKGVVPKLEGVFNQRRVTLAKQLFSLLGITKEDKEGQQAWAERMVRFHEAPAVIVIALDRMFRDDWPLFDIGFVSQNILLAAQAYGLGTCVMRAIVDYPRLIRDMAGIPETKRIVLGIAIGYEDTGHPVNSLRSEREAIANIVTFTG